MGVGYRRGDDRFPVHARDEERTESSTDEASMSRKRYEGKKMKSLEPLIALYVFASADAISVIKSTANVL